MSKKTQRILLAAAGLLVLAILLVLAFEGAFAGRTGKKKIPALAGWAGGDRTYDPDLLAPGVLKIVENKLYIPLEAGEESFEGLIVASYETARRRGEEGQRSNLYLASDQIGLGRALARMGKRSDFLRWARSFDQAFSGGEGDFHRPYIRAGDSSRPDPHWSISLAYSRALLEGYLVFGGKELASMIQRESDRLLPLFQAGKTGERLEAGPRMLLAYDEWDIPPPGSQPEPGAEAPLEYAVGTHLSDIDLWALLALSRFDPAWAPLAAQWQEILFGSRQDTGLPFYASAIDQGKDHYLALTGDKILVTAADQVKIALHLAEVGKVDRDFISFLRSRLRDDKKLPAGWNPVTGGPASEDAQSDVYAMALALGRASGDQLLMDSAREVLMYRYASSQTSDIFGGWYRPGETDRTFLLLASDNTAVLLALR